jgi:hypothetical protein
MILVEGKAAILADDSSTAIDVRARRDGGAGDEVPAGQLGVILEAKPEPQLFWTGPTLWRITRAVDDQGQKLQDVLPSAPEPAPRGSQPPKGHVGGLRLGATTVVTIPFKKGEKESHSLKELSGVVSGRLFTRAMPVITVNNLLKAEDKSFDVPGKGSLKVLEVAKDEADSVRVRVELVQPEGFLPEDSRWEPPPRGVVGAGPLYRGTFTGLGLRDDKGNALPFCALPLYRNSGTIEVKMVCPPAKDQGTPASLVYIGRRPVPVELPFKLKDVPLK